MRWWLSLVFAVALAAGAAAQSAPGPVGAPEGPWRDQLHWVPLDIGAVRHLLYTRVCRPAVVGQSGGGWGTAAVRATTRMLWVYTANDSFFAPELAAAMPPIRRTAGTPSATSSAPTARTDTACFLALTARGSGDRWSKPISPSGRRVGQGAARGTRVR